MSSPQTPTAARRDSATSTPTSLRNGASPVSLTPRSKVKAMLAALDDDDMSDADHHDVKGDADASKPSVVHAASTSSRRKLYTDQENGEPESSGGKDVEIISRPRGKLARKMQVDDGPQTEELKNDCASNEDNAYERIKRQVMGRKNSAPTAGEEMGHHSSESDIEEDGFYQPMTPTKDQLRTTPDRRTSGSPFQQSRSNSPVRSAISDTLEKPMSSRLDDSDSDLPEDPHSNPRILALAEQARQERQAKEAEAMLERKQRMDRLRELSKTKDDAEDTDDTDAEPAIEKCLTQQVRPTRKASKRALEEMNRETQRISRNMQLTHEARTKKKITKQSLFARFNYKPAGSPGDEIITSGSGAHSSSTLVSEADQPYSTAPNSTAPSSPPSTEDTPAQPAEKAKEVHSEVPAPSETIWLADDPDLPSYDQILTEKAKESMDSTKIFDRQAHPGVSKPDKGKGKARAVEPRPGSTSKEINGISRRIRIRQPIPSHRPDNSDSDLEIIPTSKAKAALMGHVCHGKESQSYPLHVQRTLARLNVPEDKTSRINGSVTQAEMQANLQREARLQAAKAQAQRLEELRRKGIVIQTAEERAKDEATIEEMIEKARKETEEIFKRERAAAKKAGNPGVADDVLDSDDEDGDAEWSGEDENIEYSGSEEEVASEENELEGDEGGEDGVVEGALHDDHQVDMLDSNLASTKVLEHTSDRDTPSPITQDPGYNRSETMKALIRSGDEKQEMIMSPNQVQNPFSMKKHIPGLPGPEGISLGLTQIFAGTMADEQTQESDTIAKSQVTKQDALDFLRQLPAISLPCFEQSLDHAMQDIVKDSQPLQSQTKFTRGVENAATSQTNLPDSQLHSQNDTPEDSLYLSYPSATQISDFPDPTQDVGFAASKPFTSRFLQSPHSTVDTVLIEKDHILTMQRSITSAIGMDGEKEQSGIVDNEANLEISTSAFEIMRNAARKPKLNEQFDRRKSRAKEMVEEQAEESEDEYAGLGGASEDDSADEEEDVEMKDMFDDRELDVDEADLAALMADKDRAEDKKQIEKIYRDVTTGMFRRKRGTDLDLSDSDYDEEARRRMKRRKEMKLRKALFADEHVEKIATNPKKSAFFQSIEDRDKTGEIDFLHEPDDEVLVPDSQESDSKRGPPSAVEFDSPRKKKNKRKLTFEEPGNEENRPPAHLRRLTKIKKPTTTDDIRECLASLIAPPNAMTTQDVVDNSDDDDDDEEVSSDLTTNTDNYNKPQNPFTRSNDMQSKIKVIDRLALLRKSNTTITTTTRLAFHDSSTSNSSFRVPALLRRATTSHLVSGGAAGGDATNNHNNNSGGGGGGASVTARNEEGSTIIKKAGSKKSCSINWYHARKQQRKVIEERGRNGRDGRIVKMGRERRGALLGGLLGGGKFE